MFRRDDNITISELKCLCCFFNSEATMNKQQYLCCNMYKKKERNKSLIQREKKNVKEIKKIIFIPISSPQPINEHPIRTRNFSIYNPISPRIKRPSLSNLSKKIPRNIECEGTYAAFLPPGIAKNWDKLVKYPAEAAR